MAALRTAMIGLMDEVINDIAQGPISFTSITIYQPFNC